MKTESRAALGSPASRRRFKLALFPGLVLALGLSMTYGLWHTARQEAAQARQEELQRLASKIASRIEDRVGDYVQILGGVAGLFDASKDVTRQEFHRYISALRLNECHSGIQGIGFSLFIAAANRSEHIAAIRREGFPGYGIRPAGERDFYTAVVYVEPFAGPNLRAFGYDMAPEPVRWAAAVRARDLGQAALSGKVALRQEESAENEAGILLFLPIYRPDAPRDTLDERRASLMGWAYSALRMHDLMGEVLKSIDVGGLPPTLQLEIYDGEIQTSNTRLFTLVPAAGEAASAVPNRVVWRLDLGGRQWWLTVNSEPGFESIERSDKAILVAFVGGTMSLLLALFVGVQTISQMRIAALLGRAARANRQLAERERDLLCAQHVAQLGSWLYDPVSRQTIWSEGMYSIWGLDPSQGVPTGDERRNRIHPDDRHRHDEALGMAVQCAEPYSLELRIRRPDGEERTIVTIGTPQRDARGQVVRLSGTDQDITERIRMQESLREQAIRDPLTGLLNRRYLDETLPRELARCRRTGESLIVAMLDLDHFKDLNDTYGHEAGDLVLRAVGELLRGFARSADLACRYGGEELTLILPGAGLEDARMRLDCLREEIEQTRIRYREGELPAITVSIGLAAAANETDDAAALMSRADAAMYRAKAQGRNRVVAVADQ